MLYKFTTITKKLIWGEELWALSAVPGFESVTTSGTQTLAQLIAEQKGALVGDDIFRRHGTAFPLLIKFITARQDLSVQVHPADEYAMKHHNCLGKNEMWYILSADPDTRFHVGFRSTITAEEYERRVADNSIMDVLGSVPVAKGDVIYLPAGRVHSIGAGARLLEVQQSSDITYRIYDYDRRDAQGNTRQLHTVQARDVLDFHALADCKQHYTMAPDTETTVVDSPFFTSSLLSLSRPKMLNLQDTPSFSLFICTEGAATLLCPGGTEMLIQPTEVVLLPACEDMVCIIPQGKTTLMHVSIK